MAQVNVDNADFLQAVTSESEPVTHWAVPVTHRRIKRTNRFADLLLASLAVTRSTQTGRHHRGER